MTRKATCSLLVLLSLETVAGFSISAVSSQHNCLRRYQRYERRKYCRLQISSTADNDSELSSSTSRGKKNADKVTQQTLYDILGASPTDSKAELKKQYVALAKKWHPDAVQVRAEGEARDFSEIASAWNILSNEKTRLAYDRNLKAQRLTEDIARYVGQRAVPVTELSVKALEKVALPFLRRTTATTLASMQAAIQNKGNWGEAVSAAKRAGQAIDKMELQEKAAELEERALVEFNKALDRRKSLRKVTLERLRLSLHTAGSGLTSNEASLLLDGYVNQTANFPPTFWERANFLKRNLEYDIARLRDSETKFVDQQSTDSTAQASFQKTVRDRLMAQTALAEAEQKEIDAKLAYERAIQEARERRSALQQIVQDLTYTEAAAQKSSSELEVISSEVNRQAEVVRSGLVRKESIVYKQKQQPGQHSEQHANRASSPSEASLTEPITNQIFADIPMSEPSNEQENRMRLEQLAVLKQEERDLTDAIESLELQAAKFLSRANKLKSRATSMERNA
jgi:curved DNA-binding protein CbpA